ncbi:unnamed protein product [Phytomonas sp. Hart1]|nr:unnamed protein product [Phytomonas sp. Hart1]|eukprot:CCW68511.1 unnamed protein product [Phytomonas sp. isolate Hart1]
MAAEPPLQRLGFRDKRGPVLERDGLAVDRGGRQGRAQEFAVRPERGHLRPGRQTLHRGGMGGVIREDDLDLRQEGLEGRVGLGEVAGAREGGVEKPRKAVNLHRHQRRE